MKEWLLIIVLSYAFPAWPQTGNDLFEKKIFISGNDTMPYRVLLPKHYDASKKYPLLIFLHGSGEKGNDNEKQLVHGASFFLSDSARDQYPAIIVFPQCAENSYWSNVQFRYDSAKKRTFDFVFNREPTVAMQLLIKLMDHLKHEYKTDKKRWYIGGLSMGGMGTFELVARKPKIFAAAFPICGGGDVSAARKMTRPNWWIFHGLKDDVVNPVYSEDMAAAIQRAGAQVKLSLYPNANHNSWDAAFAEPGLLSWLFHQHL